MEDRRVAGDEKIWRYMTFAKFASMCAAHTLHFTRLDQFHDPFEGAFPQADLPILRAAMPKGNAAYDAFAIMDQDGELYRIGTNAEQRKVRTWADAARLWRSVTFANCWHANEHESAAMWDLYVRSGEGIAIRSTPTRLIESVTPMSKNLNVEYVRYFDYDTDSFATADGMLNLNLAVLSKRSSFAHEREMRAYFIGHWRRPSDKGYNVLCDVGALVEEVYVAPMSPPWFADAVSAVTTAFGLSAPVRRSALQDSPIW